MLRRLFRGLPWLLCLIILSSCDLMAGEGSTDTSGGSEDFIVFNIMDVQDANSLFNWMLGSLVFMTLLLCIITTSDIVRIKKENAKKQEMKNRMDRDEKARKKAEKMGKWRR